MTSVIKESENEYLEISREGDNIQLAITNKLTSGKDRVTWVTLNYSQVQELVKDILTKTAYKE